MHYVRFGFAGDSAARTLFDFGGGLALKAGYLQSADGSGILQGLIASCTHKVNVPNGPGGEISIPRGPRFSSSCDGDAT
jgi:hypothetical protein